VHYTGYLADNGLKFDSSKDRDQPFIFTLGVGEVIKCWDEGIKQMSKGQVCFCFRCPWPYAAIAQTATLHCSADYAYGANGAGNLIPPNADLKFEIEILDF